MGIVIGNKIVVFGTDGITDCCAVLRAVALNGQFVCFLQIFLNQNLLKRNVHQMLSQLLLGIADTCCTFPVFRK